MDNPFPTVSTLNLLHYAIWLPFYVFSLFLWVSSESSLGCSQTHHGLPYLRPSLMVGDSAIITYVQCDLVKISDYCVGYLRPMCAFLWLV